MLAGRAMSLPNIDGNFLRINALSPSLARIPDGSFLMGSEVGQDNEKPVHRVWVDTFLIGVCQVTHVEYAQFLAATGSVPPPYWEDPTFSHPLQPVVGVSWFDAVKYCEWVSGATRRVFRLPTEAEWEFAARGGLEGKLFPWGNEAPETLPDYHVRWQQGPDPVGRYSPNRYGLHDVSQNVHEWCSDWYGVDYYGASPAHNPKGPEAGERRASRGGSWRHHIKATRCAARSSIPPHLQYADYGFRLVCEA
jgi:formylglycine-generating enzyme required for sulfatase activity